MAHRNYGQGMGGRNFGGGGGGGGGLNPWADGMAPGGGSRGGPMNSYNSNNPLMSQLSDPQAQLALALTKLLQPQQQMSNMPGHGFGNYSNRDDYDRRGRQDLRRNEPYNKMYNRNRDDYNRRRDFKSTDRNKGRNNDNKGNKTSLKPSSQKNNEKTEVKPDKEENKQSSETSDKIPTENVTSNEDINLEEEEQKRDWKDEKNDTKKDTEENETSEKMETEEDKDKDEEKDESDDEKDDFIVRKGPYTGVHKNMLNCRICTKRMNCGRSYDQHMTGRAHKQMTEIVQEGYRVRAKMMREAIRLEEEKNTIEFDRLQRKTKRRKDQQRSHCAMCDLHFYGSLLGHRKSQGHKMLKMFLHPSCNYCNRMFPTRMEWEVHRHTAEHLCKKVEVIEKQKEKQGFAIDTVDQYDDLKDLLFEIKEDPDAVIDLPEVESAEDMKDIKNRIPVYTSKRAVGVSLLKEATGYICKPCNRFFNDKETCNKHVRSKMHHENFVKILKEKITEKEAEKEAEKKRKSETDQEEGNWKRRKVEDEDGDNENDENENNDDSKMDDGNDLYDPADSFMETNEEEKEENGTADEETELETKCEKKEDDEIEETEPVTEVEVEKAEVKIEKQIKDDGKQKPLVEKQVTTKETKIAKKEVKEEVKKEETKPKPGPRSQKARRGRRL